MIKINLKLKKKFKIERVKEKCSKIFKPNNVNVEYSKNDYREIYPKVIQKINSFTKNERLLLFIDLYGYKEIKLEQLKNYLAGGKTELILFLPISFMSRVANKSLSEDYFPGGKPLRKFLFPLFKTEREIKIFTKPYAFINQLKNLLRDYFINIFVDTFTIERDLQNVYCLFFFTPHVRGFEKMLETKWKMDENMGKGFRLNSEQKSFFSEVEMSNYPDELRHFIQSEKSKTNSDLYFFGLRKGFLPTHTNQILKDWQKNNSKFKVYEVDGGEARKESFYVSYENYGSNPKKIVKFIFE